LFTNNTKNIQYVHELIRITNQWLRDHIFANEEACTDTFSFAGLISHLARDFVLAATTYTHAPENFVGEGRRLSTEGCENRRHKQELTAALHCRVPRILGDTSYVA